MDDFFTELDADIQSNTPHVPMVGRTLHEKSARGSKFATSTRKASLPKNGTEQDRKVPQNLPLPAHIADLRSQLAQDGVVIVIFRADSETGMLLGQLKLESRGFAHPKEVRMIHGSIVKKARASYESTLRDVPDIEEKDLVKIIRNDLEIFLSQRFGRNPVIVPIVVRM